MAWWNKVYSAAKSAVSKASSIVKSVVSSVKKTVSKTVSYVKKAVRNVASSAKKTVSNVVKKVSSSVKKAKDTARKIVTNSVDKARDAADTAKKIASDIVSETIENVKDKTDAVKESVRDIADKTMDKLREKVEALGWREKLTNAFKSALPLLGPPQIDVIDLTYETVTGKKLTEAESAKLKIDILDWALGLNTFSKLFFGKNLDGTPGKVETTEDYMNLATTALMFVPIGKLGKVAGKLGSKGFIKLFATKTDDAVRIFSKLNVDDQAKMIRGLLKTDEGVKTINKLLSKKALDKTLVRPTIALTNKKIEEKILGKAIPKFPTWLKAVIGVGTAGLMYVAFQWSDFVFGLRKNKILDPYPADLLNDATYKSLTVTDMLESIKWTCDAEAYKLAIEGVDEANKIWDTAINYAETHPESDKQWKNSMNALGAYLGIGGYQTTERMITAITNGKKLFNDRVEIEKTSIASNCPEIIKLKLPEKIEATVRDIIDGDTIDVGLEAVNTATAEKIKLPEYRETGHARIRIVGINSPEKSPKGEILCSDVEIFKVEKEWADKSRDELLPLNDKEVILKIDPEISMDSHNRILAVVEYEGKDVGLEQIKKGLACGYYREPHKYLDEEEYREATLTAKSEGIGMWKGLEEVEKEEEKIKIKITSTPANAKLFLDDVALHHNTPSDEVELSDVMHLFTLGPHVLSAEKGGLSAMLDIEIKKGDNGTIHLDLEAAPIEIEEAKPPEAPPEIPPEEVPPEELPPAPPVPTLPAVYTTEQEWALTEAFSQIWELTKGKEVMSEKEFVELVDSFALYTDEQKKVLDILWSELYPYIEGKAQLSTEEFNELKIKYRIS